MKRLSCSGCEQCDWMDDCLDEDVSNGDAPSFEKLNDCTLYQLQARGGHQS